MGMTPSPSSHFAGALMQLPTAIYWSNQGPFADALHRANMAELHFNEEELYRDPSGFECGVILRDLNYELFKPFLLSVLWRASVSRDAFAAIAGADTSSHTSI